MSPNFAGLSRLIDNEATRAMGIVGNHQMLGRQLRSIPRVSFGGLLDAEPSAAPMGRWK